MFDSMYHEWAQLMTPYVLPTTLAAVVMLPVGLALMVWAARRQMYRRNFAGVQEFRSYSHAVSSRLFEGIASRIGAGIFALGWFAALFAGYWLYLRRY